MDLALNNLQRLICHKIQPTSQYTHTHIYIYIERERERERKREREKERKLYNPTFIESK